MPDKRIRIAYLSSENPKNKKVWSGTHYSIFKSLSSFSEVIILGPFKPALATLIGKIIHRLALSLFHQRFDYRHSFLVSRAYGKYFTKKINQIKPDFIVAPAASCELAFVQTRVPVIYISDGTFASCLNYHQSLTHLMSRSIREGNEVEKRAIQLSAHVVVSSPWAGDSVTNYYHKEKSKVHVIPFGANLENTEPYLPMPETAISIWNILFVGVYWKNKGGDIAFNAFKKLCDEGLPVSLTVLGCQPPDEFHHPHLKVISFIDKNDPDGQKQLIEIYRKHHFLILPTRFDCTPIVINEASAFGMPSLASDTGGVAGHLINNQNGFLIPYNDSGEAYYQKIKEFISQPQQYFQLRARTRKTYEEKLNWNNWTEKIKSIIAS